MDEIEKLGRKLASCDPEGAPYDSPTGAEADGNAGYWNEFAQRLITAGLVKLDRDDAWETLVEFRSAVGGYSNPLVDDTEHYDAALDSLEGSFKIA